MNNKFKKLLHFNKYHHMAKKCHIILSGDTFMGATREYWLKKYQEDRNLNNHPLKDFDNFPLLFSGELFEKVCCLKHLIIHEFLGIEEHPIIESEEPANYYRRELKSLDTSGYMNIKVQGEGTQTKWMALNKESIQELLVFLISVY